MIQGQSRKRIFPKYEMQVLTHAHQNITIISLTALFCDTDYAVSWGVYPCVSYYTHTPPLTHSILHVILLFSTHSFCMQRIRTEKKAKRTHILVKVYILSLFKMLSDVHLTCNIPFNLSRMLTSKPFS